MPARAAPARVEIARHGVVEGAQHRAGVLARPVVSRDALALAHAGDELVGAEALGPARRAAGSGRRACRAAAPRAPCLSLRADALGEGAQRRAASRARPPPGPHRRPAAPDASMSCRVVRAVVTRCPGHHATLAEQRRQRRARAAIGR